MPTITATLEAPIHPSFRVAQVAGMFDATVCKRMQRFLKCEMPGNDEDWRIGLIVGPSGSGKSTIARAAYGDAVYSGGAWPTDRAIIDGFGEVPTKQVIRILTAVGLSSPPSWLRPYHTLSTGERFRCDLARAISDCRHGPHAEKSETRNQKSEIPPVVFDEFTSVVDRNVARVCSAAVAKYIRRERAPTRLVAVTCHYDVAEWLEPDWVLDTGNPSGDLCGRLSRRRLRRPALELRIHRAGREAWSAFAPHHYLSGEVHPSARCYLGCCAVSDRGFQISGWEEVPGRDRPDICNLQPGIPVAFAATLPLVGRKRHRRFHRLVVLPDYQGIGIGSRFMDAVADLHREEGLRINIATSHPAIVAHCRASPHWRTVSISRQGRKPRVIEGRLHGHSLGRAVASFEYTGRTPRLPGNPAMIRGRAGDSGQSPSRRSKKDRKARPGPR